MSKAIRGRGPAAVKHTSEPHCGHSPQLKEKGPQQSPIGQAMEEIDRQSGILETLLNRLQEKLDPILHPVVTGSGSDGMDAQAVSSHLVSVSRDQALRLSDLNERLESIIARIEC